MQNLGGRVAFGVQVTGFLELQSHFAGDGKARTAPQNKGAWRAHQPVRQRCPVQRQRLRELVGQRRHRLGQVVIGGPARQQRQPRHDRRDEGLGCSHAAFGTSAKRQAVFGGLGDGRSGGVRHGDGQRAAGAGGMHHLDDVRALAGLRHAQARCPPQPQRAAIDRRDRRPDRGHGHAQPDLDRVFQIGRGMVRRPARHRDQQVRIKVPQRRGGGGDRPGLLRQELPRHLRDFMHLGLHPGWQGGHDVS